MIDLKKILTAPRNMHEAIDAMIKKEEELISALHIMESIIDNPSEEFKELHEKRIKEFLSKFSVSA